MFHRNLRVLAALLATGLIALVALAMPARAVDVQYGLAGSSSFTTKSTLPMVPGQSLPPAQTFSVQNVGTADAQVQVETFAPDFVIVEIDTEPFTLKPGELKELRVGVTVKGSAPAGEAKVRLQAAQIGLPSPGPNETVFAPGFGAAFTVVVGQAPSSLTVSAVNSLDNSPVPGLITVSYTPVGGNPYILAEAEGTELQTSIAPGIYKASFEVPSLVNKVVDFEVLAGEAKVVTIPVEAVNFAAVAAKPVSDGSRVTAVTLLASVVNNIANLPGPVKFVVNVKKDGAAVETVDLQQQPTLPVGTTDLRQSYTPQGGFTPGDYTFEFVVSTPTFQVSAGEVPSLNIPTGFPLMLTGIVVLLIMIAVLVILVISRNRNTDGSPE